MGDGVTVGFGGWLDLSYEESETLVKDVYSQGPKTEVLEAHRTPGSKTLIIN